MEIHFKSAQSVENEVTPKITSIAQRKLTTLKKYLGKYDGVAHVYVEFGKDSSAHANGAIWCTQINLDCEGQRYHAKATEETLEGSLDKAMSELESELRKAKDRKQSVLKKSGGMLKSIVRGFN
jgi:ribosomal subunit interface protein